MNSLFITILEPFRKIPSSDCRALSLSPPSLITPAILQLHWWRRITDAGVHLLQQILLTQLSRGVDSKYSKPVGQSHFSVMKILHANAGALTNFEVLDFLRSRGAANDPTRVIVSVAPSEFKVFDYLNQSAVCNQTRESIEDFAEKCKQYDLAKAEILNIINVRPASAVEIDPIIEHCETRLGDSVDGLVDLVAEVLPPPPTEDAPDAEPPGVEAPDVPGQQETKTG